MTFNKFPNLAVVTSTSMHQSSLQEAVLVVARRDFSRLASYGREHTAVRGCCTSARGSLDPSAVAEVPPPHSRAADRGDRVLASLGGRRGQEGWHVRVAGPWGLGTHPLGSRPSAPARGAPRFLQGCSGEVGQAGGWARAGSAPMPEALQSPPVLKLAGGPVPLSMWVPCGLLLV